VNLPFQAEDQRSGYLSVILGDLLITGASFNTLLIGEIRFRVNIMPDGTVLLNTVSK